MTRLLHPVPEARTLLGVGRSKMYELIKAGAIPTVKVGRRTLVPHDELEHYVARLKTVKTADAEVAV